MEYALIYTAKVLSGKGNNAVSCSGITFADTYTNAMKKIEDYYGDELIECNLMFLNQIDLLEFPDRNYTTALMDDLRDNL